MASAAGKSKKLQVLMLSLHKTFFYLNLNLKREKIQKTLFKVFDVDLKYQYTQYTQYKSVQKTLSKIALFLFVLFEICKLFLKVIKSTPA